MRLLDMFLLEWKKNDLKTAILVIQDEVEGRYGVISDEDKIEKAFFFLDEQGNMSGNEVFKDCMELYAVLKELDIEDTPLMDFLEELSGWNDGYEVERLEKALDDIQLKTLKELIEKINRISCKKQLLLLQEKEGIWRLAGYCDLFDYHNGNLTFSDIQVRALLLKHLSEKKRILVIADSEKGDCCIEI